MSVTNYEKKFSALVRHVPLFCDHEVQKSKRFEVGMRKEVKSIQSLILSMDRWLRLPSG